MILPHQYTGENSPRPWSRALRWWCPAGKLIALPDHNYILGGRGDRVVVADLERNAVYAALLEQAPVKDAQP